MATAIGARPVSRGMVCLLLAGLSIAVLQPMPAQAASHDVTGMPELSCEADYGGRAETLRLQPTHDVYLTQSVRLGHRFRFHAQYLPERAKLKTWVYELRERGPLLLHAAEYATPADACSAGPIGDLDFGLNKVYSSDYERELFFRCVRRCQ